ncbi:Bifunctional purine biosynthesis protein PurH [Coemansia sp. RSA 2703]|nr:Bifunctional purine biosynthesis protein PurH [Coemansia sp. RSA 2703]KAJ2374966.1 Bifunctional purine biosynthesis protein PurH [Coemansia sp. RSA 2607]KAJ2396833.1 Bifunctional purine biosynthesis protein PurH [Coemansia sp. RSA 2603]
MWGLIVGMVALGALTGSLVAGRAADRFGRKRVLLVNNIFFIIGALLLGTSTTIAQLAIGRYVSGIGCGVASTVVATYNSECAPIKVRGFLGTVLQLSVEIGIFLSQLIATFLVQVPNWRILFGLSAGISLIQLVLLPFMPESPRYLITNGKFSEAFRALQFLRPHHNVSNEYSNLLESVSVSTATRSNIANSNHVQSENGGFSDSASAYNVPFAGKSDKKPSVSIGSKESTPTPSSFGLIDIAKGRTPDVIWHMLFCTLFLMGFQQWTGAKGIVFYSTEILEKVFDLTDTQLRHTPNIAQWVTIGISATGILAVFASMNLIDRLGRRRLLLISTGGITASCLLIVIGCACDVPILAVVAMFLFKITYGLGMAPIPWLTASEMLPYYVLGALSGFASALNWMMIFIIGLLFPVLAKALDNYLFLPFAALNFCAFIVVLLVVPETKGRHISDIIFHHGKRLHIVASLAKWRPKRKQTVDNEPYSQNN